MDKKKYDVEVWCIAKGGEIADELMNKGLGVKILNIFSYYNPFNILKLVSLFRKSSPDIVHTHGYFASTIGRIAAKITRVPVIITHLHTSFCNLNRRNVIIDKFFNVFTDRIIAVSEKIKESFAQAGYNIDKAKVIYNGVDASKFPVRSADNKMNVIIVASLYEHKGHIYLLRAFKKVLRDFPEACLWIVGEGPLRKSLERETVNMNIANQVHFWGERKNVFSLLLQSSIFVLSSIREGLGIAAIEAMATGLPLVVTNIGGLPEVVINEETGFTVPPKDSEALAETISTLLKNPELRRRMGNKGRKVFEEKFTQGKMINKLDAIYQELLENKNT